MRTQRGMAVLLMGVASVSAGAVAADPAFLRRSGADLGECSIDLSTATARYKPIFGAGDPNAHNVKGLARFGELIVAPGGSNKSVRHEDAEGIFFVLAGSGALHYAQEKIPVKQNDFAYGIKTMFHHAGSPVGAMASVHCACTIRGFVCMENHAMDIPWWDDLVTGPAKPLIQDGHYTVPDRPGLGVELNDEVVQKYLREPKYLYKAGYFELTPEFDQPIDWPEALQKKIIGGYTARGPWVHIDEEGNLVNRADSR